MPRHLRHAHHDKRHSEWLERDWKATGLGLPPSGMLARRQAHQGRGQLAATAAVCHLLQAPGVDGNGKRTITVSLQPTAGTTGCSALLGKYRVTTEFKAVSWFTTGTVAGTDNFDTATSDTLPSPLFYIGALRAPWVQGTAVGLPVQA